VEGAATETTGTGNRPATAALTIAALTLFAAGVLCAVWMLHPYSHKFDLIDLAVYRAAGRALVHGHSVYGPYVAHQLRLPLPFIYPPFAALLAAPLNLVNLWTAGVLWTALTVALLVGVVRVCFAPVLARYEHRVPIALALATAAMLALAPVEEHLRFGQVGIPLMACCVFDCMLPRTRWPRGMLIGAATAFKLVPGIFIPYLALTRRWRAAAVATITFALCSLAGLVAPHDSWDFWTDKMFQPTSPKFFSNQSLEGILQRAIGPWHPICLLAVVITLGFGLWRAAAASLAGDELRGVAITGLVGVLVSPISWIHHLVWIIPVLAVIVANGTDRRRIAAAFLIAAAFVARLPYVGNDELHGHGFGARLLEDSYGLLCVALLLYLTGAVQLAREAIRNRTGARTPATASVAHR